MPDARYEQLLADIAEGARLHYSNAGSPDPDLDLLQGDYSYAQGLLKLAELGDLEATKTLGDAIAAIAQAHAEGDPNAATAAWESALKAVRSKR